MHPELLKRVVRRCREHQEAGDCAGPVTASREQLADAIVQLASLLESPVGYIDAAKFKALQATAGGQGGVLTMVTSHRAFPEDVALYAVPVSEPAKD